MLRKLGLIIMVIAIACASSGCVDYSGMVEDMAAQSAAESDAPAETMPPFTETMFEDAAALYKHYNEVKFGETLEELTQRYGEPTVDASDNGTSYTWVMEDGYGFAATFRENGKLYAKVLYYKDLRQLGKLSAATGLDSISLLSKDYTLEMVKSALGGKGMEIMRMATDSSVNPAYQLLYLWIDEEGNFAQILFNDEKKVEQIQYNFNEDK